MEVNESMKKIATFLLASLFFLVIGYFVGFNAGVKEKVEIEKATIDNMVSILTFLSSDKDENHEFRDFWFSQYIPDKTMNEILSNCVEGKTLILPCVYVMLNKEKRIKYSSDKGDFLLPAQEFVKYGGDCEDFSNFYAYLIFILRSTGVIDSVAYLVPSNGSEVSIYFKGKKYFIEGYKLRESKLKSSGFVCFNDGLYGHCEIFVNDNLIEPQTTVKDGEYKGSYVIDEGKRKNVFVKVENGRIDVKLWQFHFKQ